MVTPLFTPPWGESTLLGYSEGLGRVRQLAQTQVRLLRVHAGGQAHLPAGQEGGSRKVAAQ